MPKIVNTKQSKTKTESSSGMASNMAEMMACTPAISASRKQKAVRWNFELNVSSSGSHRRGMKRKAKSGERNLLC